MSTGITTIGQVDEIVQLDSTSMLVNYEAPGFVLEGGINPIR
jgi:hypothetical protein